MDERGFPGRRKLIFPEARLVLKILCVGTTDEHLARIRSKLQQVLKSQALLQKENQQLRDELARLKQERTGFEQQLDELQQKTEILKYSHGEMNEAEKKQMEKRLTAYLKEIDRCIALLGQ